MDKSVHVDRDQPNANVSSFVRAQRAEAVVFARPPTLHGGDEVDRHKLCGLRRFVHLQIRAHLPGVREPKRRPSIHEEPGQASKRASDKEEREG